MNVPSHLGIATDSGRLHLRNEDAGTVGQTPAGAAFMAVADGVSGSALAQQASATAIICLRLQLLGAGSADLVSAVRQADMAVRALAKPGRSAETTVVVALQGKTDWQIAWVGDSRAYRIDLRRLHAELLTRDDALEDVNLSHYITQSLGMSDDSLMVHLSSTTVGPGQGLLLCSDGLWNYFPDNDILAAAVQATFTGTGEGAGAVCERLVAMANERGGHDNITVALYLQPD